MSNWKGTAVPNSGLVEKVYFNTHLSIEEIVAILDTLELVPVDGTGGLGYIPYANSNGISFLIYKNNEGRWYFNYVVNNSPSYFWSSKEGYVEGVVSFPLELNSENIVETYVTQTGQTMQNEKVSSLFSITPFEKGGLFETNEDGTPNTNKRIQTGISEERVNELIDLKITGWLGGES